jgi:hypothetical protein
MSASVTTRRPRLGLGRNIYLGIVRGDFAPEMNFSGRFVQAICGFIPVVGTICAIRDFEADRRMHDRLGMLLNGLTAILPGLGGFPKTVEVLHSMRYIGEAMHMRHKLATPAAPDQQRSGR